MPVWRVKQVTKLCPNLWVQGFQWPLQTPSLTTSVTLNPPKATQVTLSLKEKKKKKVLKILNQDILLVFVAENMKGWFVMRIAGFKFSPVWDF